MSAGVPNLVRPAFTVNADVENRRAHEFLKAAPGVNPPLHHIDHSRNMGHRYCSAPFGWPAGWQARFPRLPDGNRHSASARMTVFAVCEHISAPFGKFVARESIIFTLPKFRSRALYPSASENNHSSHRAIPQALSRSGFGEHWRGLWAAKKPTCFHQTAWLHWAHFDFPIAIKHSSAV